MIPFNPTLLSKEVQAFINNNLDKDISKISLSKSPFSNVSSAELANQIGAKLKAKKKLPTWFNTENIYFPPTLSIEQTSSEITAEFKASLFKGKSMVDLTLGFGVDAYYFSKKFSSVNGFEINDSLAAITKHNAQLLGLDNLNVFNGDGLEAILNDNKAYDLIYMDPARRNSAGKVFKLEDCTPNFLPHLDEILLKTKNLVIKTSPLLDLNAGLKELKNVSDVYIISVKNECKELLWIINPSYTKETTIHSVCLNSETKQFNSVLNHIPFQHKYLNPTEIEYLYEPDVALLKSGAFNEIAEHYNLTKLDLDAQLYASSEINPLFPGRIFKVKKIINANELKKIKYLSANVIVRNYPDTAQNLVKKYKVKPSQNTFLIFTSLKEFGYRIFEVEIIQYY